MSFDKYNNFLPITELGRCGDDGQPYQVVGKIHSSLGYQTVTIGFASSPDEASRLLAAAALTRKFVLLAVGDTFISTFEDGVCEGHPYGKTHCEVVNEEYIHEPLKWEEPQGEEFKGTLEEFIAKFTKDLPPWSPGAFYNPDGDMIHCYFAEAKGTEITEWLNHGISVVKDSETEKVIGVQITGITKLLLGSMADPIKKEPDVPNP